jgi:protein disulfide-isomerase A1
MFTSNVKLFVMRTSISSALIATLAPSLAASKLIQDPKSSEFTTYLTKYDRVFVSFTSNTLPSLSAYNTIFTSAATNITTPFISIDCDTEAVTCAQHAVHSYPTIRLLEKGVNEIRYRGPRTENSMRSFVKRYDLPILTHIPPQDLPAFKWSDGVVVIAHLATTESKLLDIFRSTAKRYHGTYIFGYTTFTDVTLSLEIYKPDGDNRVLSGTFTHASLSSFIQSATKSAIKTFREKDMQVFMQRDKLILYIFTPSPDSSLTADLIRELTPLAKKYESVTVWALVDDGRYGEMAGNFGVDLEDISGGVALVVHAPMNDNVFSYAQGAKIGTEEVESMLTTILQGGAKNGDVFGREVGSSKRNGKDEL